MLSPNTGTLNYRRAVLVKPLSKLNYKKALLAPPPPVPKVEIFSPDLNVQFGPILYDCIGHVTEAPYKEYDVGPTLRPVVEFEGEELKQYHDKKGIYYSKLKKDLEWVSKKIKKNIIVYVGHVEDIDRDFFPELYSSGNTLLSTLTPEFETICLLIACYSIDVATRFNAAPSYFVGHKYGKNQYSIVSFGFEELVHIYRGEIYMCENHHEKVDSFQCMYPNALYDKQNLLRNVDDKSNPLYQCCKVKYDRFKSRFVDELSTRNCIKLTKEKFLKKVEKIIRTDGTLNKQDTHNKYTIEIGDGETCPSPGCQPKNPYKGAVPIAESFDKAEKPVRLAHELYTLMIDPAKGENVVLNRIQSLPENERDVLLTNFFTLPNATLLHECVYQGFYKILIYCAKHYNIPLYRVGPYGMNLLSMGASMDAVHNLGRFDELKMLEFFDAAVKPSDHYDVINFLRYDKDEDMNGLIYHAALGNNVKLVEWYILTTFPWANLNDQSGVGDEHMPILNKLAQEHILNPYLWRILLVYGANPLDKETRSQFTAMEVFLQNIPFPAEIMYTLCIFGYTFTEPIETTIDVLNKMLKDPKEDAALKTQILTDIKILERCLKIIKSSPERKRKMRAKIIAATDKEIHENVAFYRRRIKAHEELPKLYGTLDKALKKPGVKLSKENKKTLRNRGLALLKNNAQNIMLRLESLETLIDAITVPTTNNQNGGSRRFQRTRKTSK